MPRIVRSALTALLLFPLALSACRRRAALPPVAATEPIAVPDVPVSPTDDGNDAERDRLAREREARERERERALAVLREPIHFDFDRSDLSRSARTKLDAKVELMRADRTLRIRIEGHADERGSSEYNLALGQQRAAAARRYLLLRDVAADRIDIATFGEEKPVCETATEWCWRENRRDEFAVIQR